RFRWCRVSCGQPSTTLGHCFFSRAPPSRHLYALSLHDALPISHLEDLRESFAELRSIAASVSDERIRERIAAIERRLVGASSPEPPTTTQPLSTVRLSPRETDVLACAALGSTNAEIAAQLGLREGTVKAYLSAAMSKLDASTRHAAVARARRAGLLP